MPSDDISDLAGRQSLIVGQEAGWDGWRREKRGEREPPVLWVRRERRVQTGERGASPVVIYHNVTQDALYGLA